MDASQKGIDKNQGQYNNVGLSSIIIKGNIQMKKPEIVWFLTKEIKIPITLANIIIIKTWTITIPHSIFAQLHVYVSTGYRKCLP